MLFLLWLSTAWATPHEFLPATPESEFVSNIEGEPDIGFCSEWNPEWGIRGQGCCPNRNARFAKVKSNRCAAHRFKSSFCDEMTSEQMEYSRAAARGELGDVLDAIVSDLSRRSRNQAQCSVNNGFLVWGRRIIPSEKNRLHLRTPQRCTDFGTDGMVGMIEWLGRQVGDRFPGPAYQGVKLLVGDVAAPRGGCLPGRRGRRGHLSHTSGQDADLGFLFVSEGKRSPASFVQKFEAEPNWWFVKKIFTNPFACVKMVLLDGKWIRKLAKAANGDPMWDQVKRYVKHVRHHKNHFHVRIGDIPGAPGCNQAPEPVLEEEDGDSESDLPEATLAAETESETVTESATIETDHVPSEMARPQRAIVVPVLPAVGPRAFK